MVTCPRSHSKRVAESGLEGRWTGQLSPALHPADSCKAAVAPTQGGLSPHWPLVTLVVTQPCGWLFDACPPCQAVSALETEAGGRGELVSVSLRMPRRGGCSVEVPWAEECVSQRVQVLPGSGGRRRLSRFQAAFWTLCPGSLKASVGIARASAPPARDPELLHSLAASGAEQGSRSVSEGQYMAGLGRGPGLGFPPCLRLETLSPFQKRLQGDQRRRTWPLDLP